MVAPRRRLDDPRTIRALAHPVRLALLQMLLQRGPLTATEAGEAVGVSASAASFHLRQLARYGYVEDSGEGTGRRRPWRAAPEVQDVPVAELTGEAALAASELDRVLAARAARQYDEWLRTRTSHPQKVQSVAKDVNAVLHLSVGEIEQLQQRLSAVVEEYLSSSQQPAEDALAVACVVRVFPLEHGA